MTGAGWSEINHGSPPWSHPFEGPPPPFKIASPSGTPKFSFSPFINSSSMHSVSQIIAALSLITAVCQALPRTLSSSSICPPKNFTTVTDFNVEAYMGKWFVQAQQPTSYLPFDNNFCVTANYTLLDSKTIQVVNYANVGAINSNPKGIELRGIIKDPAVPSKLSVGPKFLPNFLKGPYWIVYTSDINKETGLYDYAVIVGGSPTKENTETDGKYTGNKLIRVASLGVGSHYSITPTRQVLRRQYKPTEFQWQW